MPEEIAEQKFTGKKSRGSENDQIKAADLAINVAGSNEELEPYTAWLWARTESLLNFPPNWECVKAVAERLVVKRKLSGKEVQQIIFDTQQAEVDRLKKSMTIGC